MSLCWNSVFSRFNYKWNSQLNYSECNYCVKIPCGLMDDGNGLLALFADLAMTGFARSEITNK